MSDVARRDVVAADTHLTSKLDQQLVWKAQAEHSLPHSINPLLSVIVRNEYRTEPGRALVTRDLVTRA